MTWALTETGQTDLLNAFSFTAAAGTENTVAVYADGGALAALVLEDDNSAPSEGTVRVRAVHTADGVEDVDIWLLGDEPVELISDLAFGTAAEAIEAPNTGFSIEWISTMMLPLIRLRRSRIDGSLRECLRRFDRYPGTGCAGRNRRHCDHLLRGIGGIPCVPKGELLWCNLRRIEPPR